MDTPLVSIIVPIYKSSEYLTKCVDSLISQTLREIEIILVNDSSSDPLDDRICKAYVSKDRRIKYLIHEKNKGQGGARNTGIINASASFVGFVDSDDWVEVDMFEKLYRAIEYKKSDISQCFFREHLGTKSKIRRLKKFKKQEDFLNATNVLVWNKLFRKALFIENNIFFPEGHSHEDTATLPRLIYFVNSMARVKEPLYHYMVTREGATTANYSRIFSDHSAAFTTLKKFMIDKKVWDSLRVFFEKRMTKSLIHDVDRLIKESKLKDEEKDVILKYGLEKTAYLFRYPKKIDRSSIHGARKSLEDYRKSLIAEHLIKSLNPIDSKT